MYKIAIFASGSGSNAENIAYYFRDNDKIKVSLIISNKKDAFVHERAKSLNIPSRYLSPKEIKEESALMQVLKEFDIDFIVLAGFLLLIPEFLIREFPNRIVNIHPALLPKYGGKGMYGSNVHKAVLANNESETGITIHYVNKEYDEGEIIFQSSFKIAENESFESLEKKIHEEEYKHFPSVIEKTINLTLSE